MRKREAWAGRLVQIVTDKSLNPTKMSAASQGFFQVDPERPWGKSRVSYRMLEGEPYFHTLVWEKTPVLILDHNPCPGTDLIGVMLPDGSIACINAAWLMYIPEEA